MNTKPSKKPPKSPPRLDAIVAALDAELRLDQFQDASHNGLQVACSDKPVRRICCGVDASLPFFEAAARQGADLVVCHHGLSWGDSLRRITGLAYRQIGFLIRQDMALWACHLPLDAHPRLGNNACLARALGLRGLIPFGTYHGMTIGCRGTLPRPLDTGAFEARLQGILPGGLRSLAFGRPTIRTVGIISGGAAAEVEQAAASGLDAYITGEPTLQGYNLARQLGINAFFGGHYATESRGVQAVGSWITGRFNIPSTFIDLAIPY